MVNSSTSPRPRLKIVKASLEARVPINVVYSRHIAPHARLRTSLIYSHPGHPEFNITYLLSAFYLYRTNFLGATSDGVGRFEVYGAACADKAGPIPMISCQKYGS
jgi:hypothetical protein